MTPAKAGWRLFGEGLFIAFLVLLSVGSSGDPSFSYGLLVERVGDVTGDHSFNIGVLAVLGTVIVALFAAVIPRVESAMQARSGDRITAGARLLAVLLITYLLLYAVVEFPGAPLRTSIFMVLLAGLVWLCFEVDGRLSRTRRSALLEVLHSSAAVEDLFWSYPELLERPAARYRFAYITRITIVLVLALTALFVLAELLTILGHEALAAPLVAAAFATALPVCFLGAWRYSKLTSRNVWDRGTYLLLLLFSTTVGLAQFTNYARSTFPDTPGAFLALTPLVLFGSVATVYFFPRGGLHRAAIPSARRKLSSDLDLLQAMESEIRRAPAV